MCTTSKIDLKIIIKNINTRFLIIFRVHIAHGKMVSYITIRTRQLKYVHKVIV